MTTGEIPKKTYIENRLITRMNDADYIEYLEREMREIHRLTNLFINEMDKAQPNPHELSRQYTKLVSLIQFQRA